MKTFAALSILGAIVPALAGLAPRQNKVQPATTPITIKGNAFFRGNDRFFVRGVAYQPGGAADAKDPIADTKGLKRDIEKFKELGINTIRVYTIDNTADHTEGMKLLADAGVYLALDVSTPKYSLNRASPEAIHMSYNDVYLKHIFATIDSFGKYSNTMLFFSGNEVINEPETTFAAPYIKAVTRDMKTYISNRLDRQIPVGYSAADVKSNIYQQALYFDCGDETERSDFFALNDYSFCGSDFVTAGWDEKVEMYKDYPLPIFLSEFGCNENTREWKEIDSLYSDNMTEVYSGGIVYEYTVEANEFGLGKIQGDRITMNEDYERLIESYKENPTPVNAPYHSDKPQSQCPPADKNWEVESELLPAIPEPAQAFMGGGAGKGEGLKGEGSQWHGTPSESEAQTGEGGPTRVPVGGSSSGEQQGDNADGQGAGVAVAVPIKMAAMIAASLVFGAVLIF